MGTKTLYLPGSAQNYARARGAESEVTREQRQMIEEFDLITGKMNYYKTELEAIDPDLKLILAKPHTETLGLKPGYYHLLKEVPGVGTYIQPYEGPNGEWRDLDGGIIDMAREADMWDDRVRRDIAEQRRLAEVERQNRILRERQDRAHEFDTRLKSAMNVSISVPRNLNESSSPED